MAKRTETVYLADIIDSIERIQQYVDGVTQEEFAANLEKQDAVVRRLEIIGEAVKQISITTRTNHPAVPWRHMAGMRDMLIHQYFGISDQIVWETVTEELPPLLPLLRTMLPDTDHE